MARQNINIGTVPNDNTGDPLRDAFDKTNDNFIELYDDVAQNQSDITDLQNDIEARNIVSTSVNYTALIGDFVLVDATSGDITITLPTAVGADAKIIDLSKVDAGANKVIVQPDGAETINGNSTLTIQFQNSNATLFSDGSNWRIK